MPEFERVPEGDGMDWEIEDDLAALTPSDAAPAPDAPPASADPGADVPAGSLPTPAAPDARPASAPPGAPAEGTPAPSSTPVGFVPPAGGQPFTFKVDGREVTVPGASVHGDHIVIPRETWDRTIRSNYLGDRGIWRDKETQYQRQLQQVQAAKSDQDLRATALLEKFGELTAKGPQAMAEWLDNYYVNLPVLEAQARASAAERRAADLASVQQAQAEQQQQEAQLPVLQQHLHATLESYLQRDEYKALAPEGQELLQELWEEFAGTLFKKADRDYPEYGLKAGEWAFSYADLERVLTRRAAQAAKVSKKFTELQSAATLNAAATQRPPVTPPRTPTGQFTKAPATPKPARLTYQDVKAQMSKDLEDAFTEE